VNVFDDSESNYTSLSAVLETDLLYVINEVENYLATVDPKFQEIVSELPFLLKSVQFNSDNYKKFKNYNNLLDNVRQTSLLSLDERFSNYV
jgi:hypothetical protein